MTSSVNQPFLAAIQLFVEGSKQEIDEAVRRTGIKILGRLVEMSPVGQPETWQVNQGTHCSFRVWRISPCAPGGVCRHSRRGTQQRLGLL